MEPRWVPANPWSPPPLLAENSGQRAFTPQSLSLHGVTAALANPYHAQSPYVSAHYAQAYATQHSAGTWGRPTTTPDGYTLSSTFVPGAFNPSQSAPSQASQASKIATRRGPQTSSHTPHAPSSSWYQPGPCRCTHKQCAFTGSRKSLETHMMDRHLIFPPDWEKQKKRDEWDADPSLKGCVLRAPSP